MRIPKCVIALSLLVAGMGCTLVDGEDVMESRIISGEAFYATLEPCGENEATRVYADENLRVLWNADDRICIFDRYTYGYEYAFQGETGQNAGAFAKVATDGAFVTGNSLDNIYAVYPYSKDMGISNSGVLTLSWPSVQTYQSNSFGIGANVMVSVTTDNQLRFKNLGGYLALQLYGENISVSSITFRGNNEEKLSGKVAVTASEDQDPYSSFFTESQDAITLECPVPVRIGSTAGLATTFWLVVPPITFKNGFNIVVRTADGRAFFKSTGHRNTIPRSAIFRMDALGITPDDLVSVEEASVESALAPMYEIVRYMVFGNQRGGSEHNWMLFGLGLDTFSTMGANNQFSNWDLMTPDSGYARHYSEYMYLLADRANAVIAMLGGQSSGNEGLNSRIAEAVFLRSWAYRNLAGLFGQVIYADGQGEPILCSRDEAWAKLAADFEYAEQYLPSTPRGLGTVTKAAAAHYLAETYLCLGEFQKAEQAATRVIHGTDGNYQLMTARFGNRADQAADRYGNSLAAPQGAYWDLFRTSVKTNGSLGADSNPNNPANREAIWVAQVDYQSGDSWWRMQRPVLESVWAPWVPMGGKNGTRMGSDGKKYYIFTADAVCFPEGVEPDGSGTPAADIAEAQGRRTAYQLSTRLDSLACRTQGNNAYSGLGLLPSEWVVRPAGDVLGSFWDDPNDFRGSEIMVQRDYFTPSGKRWSEVKKEVRRRVNAGLYSLAASDTFNITPRFWKFSDDRHIFDGGNAYYDTDWYLIRIAETFLLRAEARLAQGNKIGAADDINVLRGRAGARLCSASDINIDYILDERIRELFGEEQRWVTLSRLSCNPKATYILDCYPVQNATTSNTLYARTRKYGIGYENDERGRETYIDAYGYTRHRPNIKPYNYLLPIPIQLIQSNPDLMIHQNEGYIQ